MPAYSYRRMAAARLGIKHKRVLRSEMMREVMPAVWSNCLEDHPASFDLRASVVLHANCSPRRHRFKGALVNQGNALGGVADRQRQNDYVVGTGLELSVQGVVQLFLGSPRQ